MACDFELATLLIDLSEEARILYCVIADTLYANFLDLDLSSTIPDLVQISVSLAEMLQESLRSFLASQQTAA